MSHFHERVDKNCLNCGATVQGRYCQNCGQENIEPKQSFWHLVVHFFEDITHFDGKFFSSLKYLIKKPGFLSEEFVSGRRVAYLNPIRMYIFTSALFFFILFAFGNPAIESNINDRTLEEIQKMDSLEFDQFTRNINERDDHGNKPMTRSEFQHYLDTLTQPSAIFKSKYSTIEAFDSAVIKGQQEKPGWLERKWKIRKIELSEKYGGDPKLIFKAVLEKFVHSLPQLLFVSLPFLGLILMLLYINNKRLYYTDHFIFGLHLYIFLFVVLFLVFILKKLEIHFHLPFLSVVRSSFLFVFWIYLVLAMRRFYKQSWVKTVLKFILLQVLVALLLIILFVFFLFISLLLI